MFDQPQYWVGHVPLVPQRSTLTAAAVVYFIESLCLFVVSKFQGRPNISRLGWLDNINRMSEAGSSFRVAANLLNKQVFSSLGSPNRFLWVQIGP